MMTAEQDRNCRQTAFQQEQSSFAKALHYCSIADHVADVGYKASD
jgi:hypothetical protein